MNCRQTIFGATALMFLWNAFPSSLVGGGSSSKAVSEEKKEAENSEQRVKNNKAPHFMPAPNNNFDANYLNSDQWLIDHMKSFEFGYHSWMENDWWVTYVDPKSGDTWRWDVASRTGDFFNIAINRKHDGSYNYLKTLHLLNPHGDDQLAKIIKYSFSPDFSKMISSHTKFSRDGLEVVVQMVDNLSGLYLENGKKMEWDKNSYIIGLSCSNTGNEFACVKKQGGNKIFFEFGKFTFELKSNEPESFHVKSMSFNHSGTKVGVRVGKMVQIPKEKYNRVVDDYGYIVIFDVNQDSPKPRYYPLNVPESN